MTVFVQESVVQVQRKEEIVESLGAEDAISI